MEQLTPKQTVFCQHYVAYGNATKAAKLAGYREPRRQGSRLLTFVDIQNYIASLQIDEVSERIATAQERQEFWTRVMRGEEITIVLDRHGNQVELMPEMKNRLRAAELLGRAQGDFIERVVNVDGGKLSKEQRDKMNAELMRRMVNSC